MMEPASIHANILELLGAFFIGCIITIVILWQLFIKADDIDYDDSDDGDDNQLKEQPA